MATLYFAPPTGANVIDSRVHPVNGDTNLYDGSDRFHPKCWDTYKNSYNPADTHILVSSYGPNGVPHATYLPTITLYPGTPNDFWAMPSNVPNRGNLTLIAEGPGDPDVDPYGDGQTHDDRFERKAFFQGFLVLQSTGGARTVTFKNFKVQLKGALPRTPDTTAGETWSSIYPNFNDLNGQARRSLIQNDANNGAGHIYDFDGLEICGGWGPNFDPFNPMAYLPDMASDADSQPGGHWNDPAGVLARTGGNNLYGMPGGCDFVSCGGAKIKNCYLHDLHHGFNLTMGSNSHVFTKNNCFERMYQDSVFTQLYSNTYQWGERVHIGNLIINTFGHPWDQGNPHGDGYQDFMNYTFDSTTARVGRGIYKINCGAFQINSRATIQYNFLEARDGGSGPFAYDYVMSRNEIGIGVYKFMSIGAARHADLRRGIGVLPIDKGSDSMNGNIGNAPSVGLSALSAFRTPGASFVEDMIYDQNFGFTPQTHAYNNLLSGVRGASVSNYGSVFNSTISLAANATVNDWWEAVTNRQAAHASKGPQGYPTFKDWRNEDGRFLNNPFPSRIAFSSMDDLPVSTAATSTPEMIITNVMPSVAAGLTASTEIYTPGSGESYIEYNEMPIRPLVVPSTGVFTFAAHGYANGQIKRVVGRHAAIAGVWSTTVPLYVVNATTNTFQLSLTAGGAPITGTGAGPYEVYLVPSTAIVNDWRTVAGNVTGGNYMTRRGTTAATPVTQTRFTGQLGSYQTTWSVTTASSNAFPRCSFPGTHQFQRSNTGGSGMADSMFFGLAWSGVLGGAGAARGMSGYLTGTRGPWQIFLTNTNTLRVRLRNATGAGGGSGQLCDIDFGTVDRTGSVLTEIMLVVNRNEADLSTGVAAYKRSGGTGAWTRISVSGSWGAAGPINFAYTGNPLQIFGLNDYLVAPGMEAFMITNELIDVTDDINNPAILSKFKPDWVGEFFEGFTGNRPPIAFVGKADNLNQTNPVNRGYLTNFTQSPTSSNACVAVSSQVWPPVLTMVSEVDSSSVAPYLDGTAVNVLVRPIGFANALTLTPQIKLPTDVSPVNQTPVAMPKGTGGVIIPMALPGPALPELTFLNNSIHTPPSPLTVKVWKYYTATFSKPDSGNHSITLKVEP